MKQYYCPSCGYPNPYSLHKPIGCAKCKTLFDSQYKVPVKQSVTTVQTRQTPVVEVAPVKTWDISAMECKVDFQKPSEGVKFGDAAIVGAPPEPPLPTTDMAFDPKKFLEEFSRESGERGAISEEVTE